MALASVCLRSGPRTASCKSLFSRKNCLPAACTFCDDAAKKPNLYDTLGVPPSATRSEIKKAYFDMSFKYHPDRNENCQTAATKFREVNEAYEILGNFSLKKKYDKGVPLSSVKKDPARPTKNHSAKYQSFYDGRANQGPGFGQDFDGSKEQMFDQYKKKVEKAEESAREVERSSVPNIIIFSIFLLILVRFS